MRAQTNRTMRFAPIENLTAEFAVFDARRIRAGHTGAAKYPPYPYYAPAPREGSYIG